MYSKGYYVGRNDVKRGVIMDNTIYLKNETRKRSAQAENKVMQAITEMIGAGEKISFYSVAKKTGVSRNFLYTNSKLRNAIEDLKARGKSGAAFDADKIKELDAVLLFFENERQKEEIAALKSKIEMLEKRVRLLDECLMALDKGKTSSLGYESDEISAPF